MHLICFYCRSLHICLISSVLTNPTFWGIIISAGIAVISWFVVAKNNERHEIFKLRLTERFKVRQKMFDLFIEFQILLNDAIAKNNGALSLSNSQTFINKLEEVRPYFHVYGLDRESAAFEKLIEVIENKDGTTGNQRLDLFRESYKNLSEIVLKSIREEYGY